MCLDNILKWCCRIKNNKQVGMKANFKIYTICIFKIKVFVHLLSTHEQISGRCRSIHPTVSDGYLQDSGKVVKSNFNVILLLLSSKIMSVKMNYFSKNRECLKIRNDCILDWKCLSKVVGSLQRCQREDLVIERRIGTTSINWYFCWSRQ